MTFSRAATPSVATPRLLSRLGTTQRRLSVSGSPPLRPNWKMYRTPLVRPTDGGATWRIQSPPVSVTFRRGSFVNSRK